MSNVIVPVLMVGVGVGVGGGGGVTVICVVPCAFRYSVFEPLAVMVQVVA